MLSLVTVALVCPAGNTAEPIDGCKGDALPDAVGLAARAGAAVVTGRGPYPAQLDADGLRA